ncbi:MAG TPA: cysteine peptidase family C39 domain-containing protein, partial [Chitinophagales bacterium]|nr:cysteine peptidase family C39 domain-containing protein [Chitinophagales bacterium]
METFISYRQLEPTDNSLVSLQIIAAHYGRQYSLVTLRQKISRYNYLHVPKEWCSAAQNIGLLATTHQITLNELLLETLPCVIQWKNGQYAI